MADSLIYPELFYFQWATPDDPNPRLARSCSAAATTLYCTVIPYDADGNLITGKFLMGVKNQAGYVETVYVPAGAGSIEGTTYKMTGVVRGIALEGIDFDTGNPDLAVSHQQDDPVFCNISGVIQALVAEKLVFPIFADTTERDAQIPSPVNGKSRCYVTADGLYYLYAAGAWQSVDSGTVTPNASTTVAGKVEIATQSEANAGTDTGGTGALLSVVPSNLAVLSQDNKYTYAGATAGSSTVYTATVTPAPAAYAAGQGFTVLMDETNEASPTINFNGLGAKSIVDASGSAIGASTLPSGALVNLMYNGTSFQITSYTLGSSATVYTSSQSRGSSTTRFDITNPSGTTFRYTYDGTGTDPNISLANYPVGSLVSILSFGSPGNIALVNTGIFTVTNAGANFFEVTNPIGTAENNVTLGTYGHLQQSVATWTKPLNAKSVTVEVIGAGGNGGIGSTSDRGLGGGGGAMARSIYQASSLPSTVPVLVGAGAPFSANGSFGGASSFGTLLKAFGGAPGTTGTTNGAGSGGGTGGFPATPSTAGNTVGGAPATAAGAPGIAGQGAGADATNAEYGGASGGDAGNGGGSSIYGGSGGGGGGSSAGGNGGAGGQYGSYSTGKGGTAGVGGAVGSSGGAGSSRSGFGCGDGGGGGGGSSAGTGGAGGAGGAPGGGGGGGGAGSSAGGNGGAGGQGEVRVYVYY